MKKIFFGIPVRNKKESIVFYLGCLENLNYDKKKISVYFLLNDNTDSSTQKALQCYRDKIGLDYDSFVIEERDFNAVENSRSRGIEHYTHLANLRNIVRERFLGSDCQYWFQVDADNMFRKNDLHQLLMHEKGFISGWVEHPWQYYGTGGITNILKRVKNSYRPLNIETIVKSPVIFEVDWVGGISLIRRDVADLCQYYSPVIIKGKRRVLTEETLGFCMDVQRIEEKCWIDPVIKSYHIMGENQVSEWSENFAKKQD